MQSNLNLVVKGAMAVVALVFLMAMPTKSQNTNGLNSKVNTPENTAKLSSEEKDRIDRFLAKRQKFPGPTTNEIRGSMEVILLRCNGKSEVENFLGKPTRSLKRERDSSVNEFAGYDIGDSQRIDIVLDDQGNILRIIGVGVGFNQLRVETATNGVKRVVEKAK